MLSSVASSNPVPFVQLRTTMHASHQVPCKDVTIPGVLNKIPSTTASSLALSSSETIVESSSVNSTPREVEKALVGGPHRQPTIMVSSPASTIKPPVPVLSADERKPSSVGADFTNQSSTIATTSYDEIRDQTFVCTNHTPTRTDNVPAHDIPTVLVPGGLVNHPSASRRIPRTDVMRARGLSGPPPDEVQNVSPIPVLQSRVQENTCSTSPSNSAFIWDTNVENSGSIPTDSSLPPTQIERGSSTMTSDVPLDIAMVGTSQTLERTLPYSATPPLAPRSTTVAAELPRDIFPDKTLVLAKDSVPSCGLTTLSTTLSMNERASVTSAHKPVQEATHVRSPHTDIPLKSSQTISQQTDNSLSVHRKLVTEVKLERLA